MIIRPGVLRAIRPPSRVNLLLRSEEFDNASWDKYRTNITRDAALSPDGTQTADKLVPTTTYDAHGVSQSVSVTVGVSYAYSVFVKAAGYDFAYVRDAATNAGIMVDLTNGQFVRNLFNAPDNYSIQSVGDGWYRITVIFTTTSTAASPRVGALPNEDKMNDTFAGDGSSGIYAWGAQLNPGLVATPYAKTGAAVFDRWG